MAARFMRIRRIAIPMITMVLLVSQLTGCAALAKDELTDLIKDGSDVVVSYEEVELNKQIRPDKAVKNVKVGDKEYIIPDLSDPDNSDIGIVEEDSDQELTDTELLLYFEMAYENGRDGVEREIGEQIVVELDLLDILCTMDGKELPGNYESLYRDWRPTDSVSNPEQSLFNEVNEVVYAIETVNIRSSYTTESDKLGTLSKGSSITRIGTGTGIAEGWDQVQFSTSTSNTIGFIRSTYLTTTPPQSHVTTPSTPKPSTGGSSSSGGTGGTGGSSLDGGSVPVVNGVAPNEGTNGYVDSRGGYTIDENLPDGFEIQ